MFPVLFSIGALNVSSVGIFLVLGFLFGILLIWRLARAWDLDEEKVLDLFIITFIGGLIGARVYFVIENLNLFINMPTAVVLVGKLPGFNFWGGLLGGWLTLFLLAKRFRLNFWQVADIASVGLLGGLILSNIGCLLGGCNIGVPSGSFFAVNLEGVIGKRWPVQAAEAILIALALIRVWSLALRFHQRGKIVSKVFIYLGIIWFILSPLKQNRSAMFFSIALFLLGCAIYYRITRQTPIGHIKTITQFLVKFFTQEQERKRVVQILDKTWYNQRVNTSWKIRNFKKFLKKSNVKFS